MARYKVRLNDDDTFDLLDPDGNPLDGYQNLPMPVDEDNSQGWRDIWTHAVTNGYEGPLVITIRNGFERIDNRTDVDHSPDTS